MLVAFDYDGTLSRSDPLVLVAEHAGMSGEVVSILDRIESGRTPFVQGIRSAVNHLEGLPNDDVKAAYRDLQLRSGAGQMLGELHDAEHHVAIITDAPEGAVDAVLNPQSFDVDTVVANRLPTEHGALTGEIEGPILDRGKDAALKRLAVANNLSLSETIAAGDDRRDLPMLQAAGLGVGIDPTPTVADQCDLTVPGVNRLRLRLSERGLT